MPTPVTSRLNRAQVQDIASAENINTDRNIILTGGGTLSWVSPTFAWTENLYVRNFNSSAAAHVIAPGQFTLDAASKACYIVLNRATGAYSSAGAELTLETTPEVYGGGGTQTGDDTIVIAVRGADNKLYLRNGTALVTGTITTVGATGSTETGVYQHRETISSAVNGITPVSNAVPGGSWATSAEESSPDAAQLFWVFSNASPTSPGVTTNQRTDDIYFVPGTGELEVFRNGIKLIPDYLANGDFNNTNEPALADVGDYHEVASGMGFPYALADAAGIDVTDSNVFGPGYGRWIQFYEGRQPQIGETITFRVVTSSSQNLA